MKKMRKIIFLTLLTASTVLSATCDDITCDVCCAINSTTNEPYCHNDGLTCRLKPQEDFDILVTTLLIIFGFAIGKTLDI